MAANRCHITKLSTELICLSIDNIPPASHVSFACTCKSIARCSSGILKRHKDAYNKYSVSSDLLPSTVITLLLSVFGYGDPIAAWHVRSFEVWRDRRSWEEWKPLRFDTTLADDPTPNEYSSDNCALLGECERYLGVLKDKDIEKGPDIARTQIEAGFDGPLKAILIAKLPRLLDAKFVSPLVSADMQEDTTTLGWLQVLITPGIKSDAWSFIPGRSRWFGGLKSIRSLAIGVRSETWMDEHSPNDVSASTLVSKLMRLPNIETLYMRDFTAADEPDTKYPAMTQLSSNLQHIFMDDSHDINYSFQRALALAPRDLLTMSFRATDAGSHRIDDIDQFIELLGTCNPDSIESLLFYNFQRHGDRIHGYRNSAFFAEDLKTLRALRNVSIHLDDIMLNTITPDAQPHRAKIIRTFTHGFCKHLETLRLLDFSRRTGDESNLDVNECLNEAVKQMIECGRYKNLKAVYLEGVEHAGLRTSTKSIPFQDAVEAGRQHGVDVHTLTNRIKPQHVFQWIEAPDKYDLKTGPWSPRPQDWVFDVYTGRRIPPGCGKCGNCDNCFSQYPKELWD